MYSLTYRAQSETFYIDLVKGYPLQLSCVVGSLYFGILVNMAHKEKVERMYVHARISVHVGYREQILYGIGGYNEASLFLYLPNHALFGVLVVINKAAWKVECALCGLFASSGNKQLVL